MSERVIDKKAVGLGRGLDSLLEDNLPNVVVKPSVIHKGEVENEATAQNDRIKERKEGT